MSIGASAPILALQWSPGPQHTVFLHLPEGFTMGKSCIVEQLSQAAVGPGDDNDMRMYVDIC